MNATQTYRDTLAIALRATKDAALRRERRDAIADEYNAARDAVEITGTPAARKATALRLVEEAEAALDGCRKAAEENAAKGHGHAAALYALGAIRAFAKWSEARAVLDAANTRAFWRAA